MQKALNSRQLESPYVFFEVISLWLLEEVAKVYMEKGVHIRVLREFVMTHT